MVEGDKGKLFFSFYFFLTKGNFIEMFYPALIS